MLRGILGRVGTAHHHLAEVQPGDFEKGYGGRAGVGRESAAHPAVGKGKRGCRLRIAQYILAISIKA